MSEPLYLHFRYADNRTLKYHYRTYHTALVSLLKSHLQNDTSINAAHIQLLYENKLLVDHQPLVDQDVPANALMTIIDIFALAQYVEANWAVTDGKAFVQNLTVTSLNQASRIQYGDFRSNATTYEQEFRQFLNRSAHHRLWRERSFANRLPTDHQGLAFTEALQSPQYSILWDSFHLGKPYWDSLPVIHKQTTGLCFLHAAVVLAHYQVTIDSNGAENRLLDLGKAVEYYVRERRGNVAAFVANDEGGRSFEALRLFLNLKPTDFDNYRFISPKSPRMFTPFWEFCADKLAAGQVALVSNFRVYDISFFDHEIGSPIEVNSAGLPDGTMDGLHSMLLVGMLKVTKDGEANYYFLLQNWYEGQYFIQINAQYLAVMNESTLWWINRRNGQPVTCYASTIPETTLKEFTTCAETAADHANADF